MRRQTYCRERGAGWDGKETPRERGALCARSHSQKETEVRPNVKEGEDAHTAESDRHCGEETHIPRKTDTSRRRDTCTPKDTLRASHRGAVKGALSLKRQSHRPWQRCADESGRNTSKKRQRHEHSQRQGEKQREKHRYAQAEGESGQREIQFERQTMRCPAKGRNSGRMGGWVGWIGINVGR